MESNMFSYEDKDFYNDISNFVSQQLKLEPNLFANISNITSLVFYNMPDINWCGFYVLEPETGDLVLGPFQGKIACTRIPTSKGVCGAAFSQKRILCVDDVHQFPGHIACDSASNSELVIPFRFGKLGEKNFVEGVFDLDSPRFSRFASKDIEGLKNLIQVIESFLR